MSSIFVVDKRLRRRLADGVNTLGARPTPTVTETGNSKVNEPLQQLILATLGDRPIAYYTVLARALHSTTAGILLSQFLYWTPRTRDTGGWFWKTQTDIANETALTRSEQETARAILSKAGVIEEERVGVPARLHFRVRMDGLAALLQANAAAESHESSSDGDAALNIPGSPAASQHAGTPHEYAEILQTRLQDSRKLDCDDPANKPAAFPQTNTEITTQNTSEITNITDDGDRADAQDQLIQAGVTSRQAKRLAGLFDPAYILAKIDAVTYLRSVKSPLVARNSPGFLIRSIEDHYVAPQGYQSRQEREQQAAERKRRDDELADATAAQRQAIATFSHDQPIKPIAGTDLTTKTAWQSARARLATRHPPLILDLSLKSAVLLDLDQNEVAVGTPYAYHAEHLIKFLPLIEEALSSVLSRPVHMQVIVVPLPTADKKDASRPLRKK